MNKKPQLIGGIEAGGTKVICAVADAPTNIIKEIEIKTTSPEETLEEVADFFRKACDPDQHISALGVGSFGPISINPSDEDYGKILESPKPGWTGFDLGAALQDAIGAPMSISTDVNAALIAETTYGVAQGCAHVIYVTVGTGIGAGVLVDGKILCGTGHPEIGHMFLPKEPDDDYEGKCPFHGDSCAEGLASGPSIVARWGRPGNELAPDHPGWDLQARYLASLCVSLILNFGPQKIIMGGGVMKNEDLLPLIRSYTEERLNGYGRHLTRDLDMEDRVTTPALGQLAGIIGALQLAKTATQSGARS